MSKIITSKSVMFVDSVVRSNVRRSVKSCTP